MKYLLIFLLLTACEPYHPKVDKVDMNECFRSGGDEFQFHYYTNSWTCVFKNNSCNL